MAQFLGGKINARGGSKWSSARYKMVADQALRFPRLLGETGENLFGALCTNFLDLGLNERKAVLAKTIMALTWAESDFIQKSHGDENNASQLSRGQLQLSSDVYKNYKCRGNIETVNPSSVDCAFKIFSFWGGVSSPRTFWSVMRQGFTAQWDHPDRVKRTKKGKRVRIDGGSKSIVHPMERRLMPAFRAYVPECKTSIPAELGHRESKPPPPLEWVGADLFN
jgi:hypothetical protein